MHFDITYPRGSIAVDTAITRAEYNHSKACIIRALRHYNVVNLPALDVVP